MSLLAPTSPRRCWWLFALYLAAIFLTLPFVGDVAIALRQKHLMGAAVTSVYFVTAVAVAYYVVFDVRLSDRLAFLALALLAGAIGSLVLGLSVPEERIHFLEYGILALLARRALMWHLDPRAQYAVAWLVASLAGLADETIQGLWLEGRYGGVRDVLLNAISAFLALAADEALQNRLGWLPPRRVPEDA